jgi:hypothetical protein
VPNEVSTWPHHLLVVVVVFGHNKATPPRRGLLCEFGRILENNGRTNTALRHTQMLRNMVNGFSKIISTRRGKARDTLSTAALSGSAQRRTGCVLFKAVLSAPVFRELFRPSHMPCAAVCTKLCLLLPDVIARQTMGTRISYGTYGTLLRPS